MRSSTPLVCAISTVVAFGACRSERETNLPAQPDEEFGFAALIDRGQAATVGPIVRTRRLYDGEYELTAPRNDLSVRLYFIDRAELERAARAACSALSTATERIVCLENAGECSEPGECLEPHTLLEGCEERAPMVGELSMKTYDSAGSGLVGPTSIANVTEVPELVLCGPRLRGTCPSRLAGFLITEQGTYGCSAPALQADCNLTIDLQGCGYGQLSVTLDEAGAPVSSGGGGCAIEPTASSDQAFGAEAFALVCGERRFVATYAERILGTATCANPGPSIFRHRGSRPGAITGILRIEDAEGESVYALSGTGFDECAERGCPGETQPANCEVCVTGCEVNFSLDECTFTWPECVGSLAKLSCLERCQRWCGGPDQCDPVVGATVTLTTPDAPHDDFLRARVGMDRFDDLPAVGATGLALTVLGDDQVLLAVNATTATVLSAPAGSPAALSPSDSENVGFLVTGVLAVPDVDGEFIAYGRSRRTGRAVVQPISARRLEALTLSIPDPLLVPGDLQTVGTAAIVGNGRWVAIAPEVDDRGPQRLELIALRGDPAPNGLQLSLPVTAMTSLGNEAALVTLFDEAAAEAVFQVLTISETGIDIVAEVRAPRGFNARALAPDPEACTSDRCEVFVGFDRVDRTNPGAVGLFSYDATPGGSRLLPVYVELETPTADLLLIDRSRNELWAADRRHNVLNRVLLAN